MDRDCNKCIHHISGSCSAWKCDMQTLEDYRNEVIDEFAERLKEMLKGMQMVELQGEDICPCSESGEECPYINQDIGCQYCAREQTIKDIDRIAKEMRGSE